ncbi:putative membrane protein, partial [Vibrio parahaemolyticus EKP-028]
VLLPIFLVYNLKNLGILMVILSIWRHTACQMIKAIRSIICCTIV